MHQWCHMQRPTTAVRIHEWIHEAKVFGKNIRGNLGGPFCTVVWAKRAMLIQIFRIHLN